MDKKGVSPFISIILLVALAVTIAAFVMNWTDILTKETAEQVEEQIIKETVCNFNVGLAIWRDLSGYQRICLNSTSEELQIIFENKGSRKIEKIHSSVLLEDSSLSSELDIDIVPGGIRAGKIEVNVSSPSSIQQVVFTPAIKTGEKTYWCSDNKVTARGSSISTC